MSRQSKPSWWRLYLIGAAGCIGLIGEMLFEVPPQARTLLLLGWVLLVFSLIGKWIMDNSSALNALDEHATRTKTATKTAKQPGRGHLQAACVRVPDHLAQRNLGKSKILTRKGKSL